MALYILLLVAVAVIIGVALHSTANRQRAWKEMRRDQHRHDEDNDST